MSLLDSINQFQFRPYAHNVIPKRSSFGRRLVWRGDAHVQVRHSRVVRTPIRSKTHPARGRLWAGMGVWMPLIA